MQTNKKIEQRIALLQAGQNVLQMVTDRRDWHAEYTGDEGYKIPQVGTSAYVDYMAYDRIIEELEKIIDKF